MKLNFRICLHENKFQRNLKNKFFQPTYTDEILVKDNLRIRKENARAFGTELNREHGHGIFKGKLNEFFTNYTIEELAEPNYLDKNNLETCYKYLNTIVPSATRSNLSGITINFNIPFRDKSNSKFLLNLKGLHYKLSNNVIIKKQNDILTINISGSKSQKNKYYGIKLAIYYNSKNGNSNIYLSVYFSRKYFSPKLNISSLDCLLKENILQQLYLEAFNVVKRNYILIDEYEHKNIKESDKNLLRDYCSPTYWLSIRNRLSRKTMSKKRALFISLLDKYNLRSSHDQILDNIQNEITQIF